MGSHMSDVMDVKPGHPVLRAPECERITVQQRCPPSPPTRFGRGRATGEPAARLDPRTPRMRGVRALPRGDVITVRPADAADLKAAEEMHGRCSAHTLSMRYQGPRAMRTGTSTLC